MYNFVIKGSSSSAELSVKFYQCRFSVGLSIRLISQRKKKKLSLKNSLAHQTRLAVIRQLSAGLTKWSIN